MSPKLLLPRLTIAVLVAIAAFPLQAQIKNLESGTAPGTYTGPTSSQTPYVIPAAAGWETVSLISVADGAKENGYRMVGIPDGLGALPGKFEQGNYIADTGYMTVFMNHELGNTSGIERAHGVTGAFVSQWTIHLNSLQVKRGEDLIRDVYLWDIPTSQHILSNATAESRFQRLCSADLPAYGAFFNSGTGKGFDGRLFMNGEETSNGRGFAHVVTGVQKGTTYELPYLGRFAWENNVAHPSAGDKTIVIGLDDSTPGQVYLYVGNKTNTGNPIEKAGLVGGSLYGIRVTDGGPNYANSPVPLENNGPITNGAFTLVNVSDVAVGPATTLQSTSVTRGITEFARPEDGAWDTQNPLVFYFVVTGADVDGSGGPAPFQSARLYKLTFDSLVNPTGGAIELIVDRRNLDNVYDSFPTTAQFDNLAVDADGMVLVQEDPGGASYLAKTWRIDPNTKSGTPILTSDPARFGLPTLPPFDTDDESSGIIEVTDIVKNANWYEQGRRYFLADIQAHYETGDTETVQGGQFYLIASPK